MIREKMNLEEVKNFIRSQPRESKVYIGSDSERFKINGVWHADYTLAVVVHLKGRHGCKIFGEIHRERDFDQKQDKPSLRLMNEVFKVAELFNNLKDVLEDRYVEVHLDINPGPEFGSNCVMQQAVGYIRGTCNLDPKIKPQAFAASYCADRLKEIIHSAQ